MTSIVKQTRYGDTMFVSNPILAAKAIVLWATADGHTLVEIENLGHGWIRVNIPGVTKITFASEKNHELMDCDC